MKGQLIAVALAFMLASSLFFMTQQQAQAAPATSFVNVDISATLNPNDMPFGIECTGDSVYMTIFQQGMLAKIDKSTKAVSLIQHPEGAQAAGRGFYSLARDGGGNIYVNEVNNGKIWQYNPTSETWTPIPIVEEITGNPDVTYPEGFVNKPNLIRIDESTGDHNIHTYHVSMATYGGLVYANGYVWAGLQYNVDFDEQAETHAGVTDMQFSGLARIDPSTLAVMRIAIAGSTAPSAMSVDKSSSTIIWVTDNGASKVYKFNATSGTVVSTVDMPAGSNPRGLDNDASFLYVALDKPAGGNSQIMKIDKANTASQTVIDTTAPNTNQGTFNVFLAGSNLIWTDSSAHVGTIDLSTSTKSYSNTTFGQSNRFGCLAKSTEFWWASHGSVVAGILDLSFDDEEPEAPPVDDDEESGDDETPSERSDRHPPSKKGLALGYVFSCYYSHVNCELIATIEPAVMEWLKDTNAVRHNPEVLTVLE